MGTESNNNQSNEPKMGNKPAKITTLYSYVVELSYREGFYELDLSNNINNQYLVMSLTKDELKGLADFINQYLENN